MSLRKPSTIGAAVLVALLLAAFVIALEALAPAAASANVETCPNAEERFGPSANLPDCRVYELVTPAVKEDNSFIFGAFGFADGEHVYYTSDLPLPGAKNGSEEASLSSRTAAGWITTPLTPPQGPGAVETLNGSGPSRVSFTSNFSAAFIQSPFAADPRDQNLKDDVYRVDIPGGGSSIESLPDTGAMTEELYAPPPGVTYGEETPEGSFPAGNSADGSHVFFETPARLPTAPGTPADTHLSGNELYERRGDHTYVVDVLPDGSVAPCGAEVGNGGSTGMDYYVYVRDGAVSPDGSNVVFHTYADNFLPTPQCEKSFRAGVGALYLREDNGTPQAKTVELPGQYYVARTADGLKVLSDGGPGGTAEGPPIYEYDIPTGTTTLVGYGGLVADSADGSVVYYVTHVQDYLGGTSQESQLKVYRGGTTSVIPGAGPGYAGGFYEPGRPSDVGFTVSELALATPDGSKLLFLDRADLTGYDNVGPGCQEGLVPNPHHCAEAYIYDLNTGSFTCVSCNPSGAPPVTNVNLYATQNDSLIPLTPPLLSEDGSRAFFQTSEALVPHDTNGANDVYEWENGHIYLLSSGQGGQIGVQETHKVGEYGISGVTGSILVGVSSNGDNVFIETADHLAPQDEEDSLAIYDVRVGGGFPYTPPVGYGCDSGQCQGPQTPAPVFAPPASATFVGVGNPVQEATVSPAKTQKVVRKVKHRTKKRAVGGRGRAKRKGRK
jgi:hypothetical protein